MNKSIIFSKQSLGEEITNSILHGSGALASLIGLVILLYHSPSLQYSVVSSIYCISLFLLFMMSTLHHSLTSPKAKFVFLILDYSAIYLVIAATFTVFLTLVTDLNSMTNLFLLVSIWALAVIGIVLSAIFSKRIHRIAPIFYLAMGWLSIFIIPSLYKTSGLTITSLVITGGIIYTIGTYWYLKDIKPYHHAVWHALVLLASIFHYFAIFLLK